MSLSRAFAAGVCAIAALPAVGQVDRVLATGRDGLRVAGHVYQIGVERVVLDARPRAQRAGEVAQWVHNEPLFGIDGTVSCPDAIRLAALALPGAGGQPPVYSSYSANASFDADTVIDTIQFATSLLPEPTATQGNGVSDAVPLNDIAIIVDDGENFLDGIPTSRGAFGVVLLDLPGDDAPAQPGFAVQLITIDLAAAGLAFELGDSNGAAEEDCVASSFNANSFVDLGFSVDPSGPDGLHDARYSYFFYQPDGSGGQLNPQDSADWPFVQPQGLLMGFSDETAIASLNGEPFATAIGQRGDARNSFNALGIVDLTVSAALGGVDFFADPFGSATGNWILESGPAFSGPVCVDGVSIPPFFAQPGEASCPFVCSDTMAAGSGGNEPFIGFFGPTPGTCGAPGNGPQCRRASPCLADIAAPFGILELSDADAFIATFLAGDDCADFAAPFGVIDLSDIDLFIMAFLFGFGC